MTVIVGVGVMVTCTAAAVVVAVGWVLRWPLWRPLAFAFDPLARALPRPVPPSRLQRRILGLAVDKVAVGVNCGVLAPSRLEVRLAAEDLEILGGVGDWFARELASAFSDAVVARGGPPRLPSVTVTTDRERPPGRPRVLAWFEAATVAMGPWDPSATTQRGPAPTAALPRWSLEPVGQADGAAIHLSGREVVIGRSHEVDVRVRDLTVSARHVRLLSTGKGWVVTDLGSTNGTFVNGRRLAHTPEPLAEGDRLGMGKSTWRLERT
jgi:Inner membrane component of T3SS, cytoplasmic domain